LGPFWRHSVDANKLIQMRDFSIRESSKCPKSPDPLAAKKRSKGRKRNEGGKREEGKRKRFWKREGKWTVGQNQKGTDERKRG